MEEYFVSVKYCMTAITASHGVINDIEKFLKQETDCLYRCERWYWIKCDRNEIKFQRKVVILERISYV
jgi:hypothetical protein